MLRASFLLSLLAATVAAQPPAGGGAAGPAGESGLFLLRAETRRCQPQGASESGQTGLFLLRSAHTLCPGRWQVALYANEWDRRVTGIPGRDGLWNDWDLDRRRTGLAVGYGLNERWELSAVLPQESYSARGFEVLVDDHLLVQGGRLNGREVFRSFDVEGTGDVRLGAKYRLRQRPGYALAAHAFADLSTGDDEKAVVTGDLGLGAGLAWSVGDWVFNAAYYDPGEPSGGAVSDQVQLGVGYRRSLSERLEWIAELYGAIKTQGQEEHGEADLTSGGRLRLGRNGVWALSFALRVDLSEGEDTWNRYNPLGWLVGLSWSPRSSYRLEVEPDRSASCFGAVISDPAGEPCEAEGARCHCCADEVLLIAVPDGELCEFRGWGGDCSGRDPLLRLKMNRDLRCSARFESVEAALPGGTP